MSKQTNEQKIRKMCGIDRDENGNTWLDVISQVWNATFGAPYDNTEMKF